ncbi:MAG: NADH-quinone oxidoreductase subunit N [Firmicutes bacterium]|nr:NADH-quinone oxidoreductase subunit N [Bacillota bacterium]
MAFPLSLLYPEIILTGLGLLLLCTDLLLGRESKKGLMYLTIVGAAAAAAALVPLAGLRQEILEGTMLLDPFAVFFKAVALAILVLVALVSWEYVERNRIRSGEFFALLTFATLGLMFMVSSRDLITIYLGLELSSISTYILAGIMRDDAHSNEAAVKYFLVGTLASGVLLYGMSLLYGVAGTTYLPEIARVLQGAAGGTAGVGAAAGNGGLSALAVVATIFLVGGFGFKIAAVPFHMWVPDTYEGAPTPVTAFISVGPKAAALAVLLRVFPGGLEGTGAQWTVIFAFLAAVSMTLGNLTALTQPNIKRMLGYSSIAQLGYILIGLVTWREQGGAAILFYVLTYSIANLSAFAVIIAAGNRLGSDELDAYAGLSQKSPLAAWTLTVAFAALIGIPPTGVFFGKFFIFMSALQGGYLWLALLLAANSVISAGYYFGVVRRMFLVPPTVDTPVQLPRALSLAALLTLAAVLATGLAVEPLFRWASLAAVLP